MPTQPGASYARLGAYLATRQQAGAARVTLPFATVEAAILGRPLPATARAPQRYRGWWRGSGMQVHAWEGWLGVGWHVAAVDLAAGTVTFARAGATA